MGEPSPTRLLLLFMLTLFEDCGLIQFGPLLSSVMRGLVRYNSYNKNVRGRGSIDLATNESGSHDGQYVSSYVGKPDSMVRRTDQENEARSTYGFYLT